LKAISVIKNRLSAHETSIREFKITSDGLAIGAPLTKFEGILSGIPRYLGELDELLSGQSAADEAGWPATS
jgi:circadian clock protein KaiC